MKTCDEYQARLSAYLDGEAGDQEEVIRAHVRSCRACRKMLDNLGHVSARIRDIDTLPATLVEEIRRRVREGSQHRRSNTLVPKLATAAAMLAVALWMAVLAATAGDDEIRLSNFAPGDDLSQTERRILYEEPPTDDDLLASVLTGGSPQ